MYMYLLKLKKIKQKTNMSNEYNALEIYESSYFLY